MVRHREVALHPHPGIDVVAVRTPTLPPATHTNVYVAGTGRLTVFDPASPFEEEQARLGAYLDARIRGGERVERIVLTHHHLDHVSGAAALRQHLWDRHREAVPIAAHPWTAAHVPLEGIDVALDDRQELLCGGRRLLARHTPGHAPGHLVFHDTDSAAMIAGDMVAGTGTVLIDPVDGDLGQYLASLAAMAALEPEVLLPAHGPALPHAMAVIGFYVAHRHQRTDQIRRALADTGRCSPIDLAPLVYPELPASSHRMAAAQITSHLRWMEREGLARRRGGAWER